MAENFEKMVENILNELRRLSDIEKAYNLLVKVLEKTSEKDIGVQQDERVFERIAAMKKSPEQTDQIQQIAEALRKHGLTLVKTAAGYDVMKLGEITAQQEPVAKVCHDLEGHVGWNPDLKQLPEEGAPLYTRPQAREPLGDERIESVRHMRDVQGYDGNWNYDPYMQGLYNGLEFALSLLEVREPQFKGAPEKWLGDIKVKRDKLSRGAAHGIKENT
jgi:hypothetical protein